MDYVSPNVAFGINTFYIVILSCQAFAYTYFAAFVDLELSPYFAEHGTWWDYNTAEEVLVYLILTAVMLWTSLFLLIYNTCSCTEHGTSRVLQEEQLLSVFGLTVRYFLGILGMIALLTLSCIIARQTWAWRYQFDEEGLDHLAATCHGLAAVVIASLAITAIVLTVIVVTAIRRHL